MTSTNQPIPHPVSAATTLVDLLSSRNSPIQKTLLSFLGPAEINNLERTSTGFYDMSSILASSSYNINVKLQKFFSDPQEFRSLQGACNALIAGNFAYRFFVREEHITTTEADNTLLIYADSNAVGNLYTYVTGQSYEQKIVEGDSVESEDEVEEKPMLLYKKTTKQTLVVSFEKTDTQPSIAGLLSNATSTAGLNFITWDKAYSLFPRHTFAKNETYLLKQLDDERAAELAQFTARGMKIQCYCLKGGDKAICALRHIGDKFTWTIPLDTAEVSIPKKPDHVLETSTFTVYPLKDEGEGRRYNLGVKVISSSILKFDYVAASEEYRPFSSYRDDDADAHHHKKYFSKLSKLEDWLKDTLRVQIMLLPSNQRRMDQYGRVELVDLPCNYKAMISSATGTLRDDEVVDYLLGAWRDEQLCEGGDRLAYKSNALDEDDMEMDE